MKTHADQMAEIDKHLQIKFIDLQSFEQKARAEKGFLKKWEENKVLDGVKEIRYFNYLIAELKHFQALSLNAPSELKRKTQEEIHAEFVAMESNLESKIKKGLEKKLEKFIQSDSVLKILNEAKDFRDQILDRLCSEMDSFLNKWNALTNEQKHGFEAKQLDLNTFGEITKLLNLYRRLKNEQKKSN